MRQTPLESFIEQLFNVGSGFIIAYLVWHLGLTPLIEIGYLSIYNSLTITSVFTVISVIRGFFWRRIFSKRVIHKLSYFILSFVRRS
jgi:hypothetical protein